MNRKIALGVTSSVSIYKACDVLRGLKRNGFDVQVIMTANAAKLVSPLLFSSLSGLRTIVDMWDEPEVRTIAHISLASEVSALLVAPATADIIGKFAGGIADDFLSTFFLSVRVPVIIAPAMNEAMYMHPRTQANIAVLKGQGAVFIGPERGDLACGAEGTGRLARPEVIVEETLAAVEGTRKLEGLKVLVTSGPTREHLDPVRYISNPSSGKMGAALAREAAARGAEVVLVSGPTSLEPPWGVETVPVVTAEEMRKAVLERMDGCDVLIMAAAVSDFRFKTTYDRKVGKAEIPASLEMERTPDILALASSVKRKGQLLVGFAAETDDMIGHAREKMARKGADIMVANKVGGGKGFGTDDNEATVILPSGRTRHIPRMSKNALSRIILDIVGESIGKKKGNKPGDRRS